LEEKYNMKKNYLYNNFMKNLLVMKQISLGLRTSKIIRRPYRTQKGWRMMMSIHRRSPK